jgi:GTPase SAR1 family protein
MTGKKTDAPKMVFNKPKRTFEKSGSVNPKASYYVSLENVVNKDKQDIKTMVDSGRYFSIFAPRQSGKTTFLKRFCQNLEKDRSYIPILLSFERYSKLDVKTFYGQIQKYLYRGLIDRVTSLDCDKSDEIKSFLSHHQLTGHLSFSHLFEELNRIIQLKKIIVFIDEFDGIPLDELGNFLTAIRGLYLDYKEVEPKALYSVGLMGIRNITKLVVGGVSPFNIADQVHLPPFSLENIHDLFSQYTEETNQPFSDGAIKKIHAESEGQPWLVNRLGTMLTKDIKPETIEPIHENDVEKAVRVLLKERNDHFDNLYEKAKLYKETFVEIVFDHVEYHPDDPDQSWLEQYGLVKNKEGEAKVANNIYKARFLKTFFKEVRADRDIRLHEYELPGNKLDMERILLDFEQYIAQIGVAAFYQEWAAPPGTPLNDNGIKAQKPYEKTGQFLLTAWLYQFVKSGAGELHYEVPSGIGRMDILLSYKNRKYIIETKINRRTLSRTIDDGINQLSDRYLASQRADEGYLVVFDVKTPAGEECQPQYHEAGNKKITGFTIAIGKDD